MQLWTMHIILFAYIKLWDFIASSVTVVETVIITREGTEGTKKCLTDLSAIPIQAASQQRNFNTLNLNFDSRMKM